jgi:hypothetical protein
MGERKREEGGGVAKQVLITTRSTVEVCREGRREKEREGDGPSVV